jgi:hypothetical protein
MGWVGGWSGEQKNESTNYKKHNVTLVYCSSDCNLWKETLEIVVTFSIT